MGWRSGQSYSQDLRDRVLSAVDGGMAVRQAARPVVKKSPARSRAGQAGRRLDIIALAIEAGI